MLSLACRSQLQGGDKWGPTRRRFLEESLSYCKRVPGDLSPVLGLGFTAREVAQGARVHVHPSDTRSASARPRPPLKLRGPWRAREAGVGVLSPALGSSSSLTPRASWASGDCAQFRH